MIGYYHLEDGTGSHHPRRAFAVRKYTSLLTMKSLAFILVEHGGHSKNDQALIDGLDMGVVNCRLIGPSSR
jgi:hypothetical protein